MSVVVVVPVRAIVLVVVSPIVLGMVPVPHGGDGASGCEGDRFGASSQQKPKNAKIHIEIFCRLAKNKPIPVLKRF